MLKSCLGTACTNPKDFTSARQQHSTIISYTKAFQIWKDMLMAEQEQETWKPS